MDKITVLLADPERRMARKQGPTFTERCEQLLTKYDADGSTHRTYTFALTHWKRLLGEHTRRAAITDKAVQAAVDKLATAKAPGTVGVSYAALRLALSADHPALKDITLPEEEDEDEEPTVLVPADLATRLQTAAQYHPMGIMIGQSLAPACVQARLPRSAGRMWTSPITGCQSMAQSSDLQAVGSVTKPKAGRCAAGDPGRRTFPGFATRSQPRSNPHAPYRSTKRRES